MCRLYHHNRRLYYVVGRGLWWQIWVWQPAVPLPLCTFGKFNLPEAQFSLLKMACSSPTCADIEHPAWYTCSVLTINGVCVCACMIYLLYVCVCAHTHTELSRVWLLQPWTVARRPPLSMVPKQKYWIRLPFPPLGDIPNPGIKLTSSCVTCVGRWILYH